MAKPVPRLSPDEIQRIIATAWDDQPPFDRVLRLHGLNHGQVVQLLKRELTPNAGSIPFRVERDSHIRRLLR